MPPRHAVLTATLAVTACGTAMLGPTPRLSSPESLLDRHTCCAFQAPGAAATLADLACAPYEPTDSPTDAPDAPPNILFLLMDDTGVEMVDAYGAQLQAPATPNLDALADAGVLFESAYVNPSCSPSRAAMLTGLRTWRYGIGSPIELDKDDIELPHDTTTLPELYAAHSPWTWDTTLLGKWHLTSHSRDPVSAPHDHGFDEFRGTPGNLTVAHSPVGDAQGFFHWDKVDNGEVVRAGGYITSDTVDDALEFTQRAQEPWLAWVAFHAIHTPWHSPPEDLQERGDLTQADTPTQARAMMEALDHEIGRLLWGMEPALRERTQIWVIGDNGSTRPVGVGEYAGIRGKTTVLEGGVHVPLIISGASVTSPGRRTDALVEAVDIFATLAELGGVHPEDLDARLDGVSFAEVLRDPNAHGRRQWVSAEEFSPPGLGPYLEGSRMIRDDTYKLVRDLEEPDRIYAPPPMSLDGDPIPKGQAPYRALVDIMETCFPSL